jgi:outer membrane protein OmpA-like peptidoglycan-associated protein/opacity protein-like surface antigen
VILLVIANSVELPAQKIEIGLFGGGSWFSRPGFTALKPTLVPTPFDENDPEATPLATEQLVPTRIDYNLAAGGVFGIRARQHLTNHFALEQAYHWTGTNNAVFQGNNVAVGMRTHALYFNGDYFMLSTEKKFRPYLSGGFGWSYFNPTDEGRAEAEPFLGPYNATFDSFSTTAWNFGVGAKWQLSRHLGLDFSFRDFIHHSPTFNIPTATDRDLDNNTQLQLGFMFGFGGYKPLLVHNFTVAPTIEASSASLCPGESSTLRIAASDSIAGNDISYKWTSMGRQVSTDPTYTFVAPSTPGPQDVGVTVYYDTGNLTKEEKKAVEKNRFTPVDRRITLNVKDYNEPIASAAIDKTRVQRNERVRLTSTATGSECSGNLAYRWSASDGRMLASADSKSAEFDGSTLAFSDSIQGEQCKPVTVSLEVTDQRGGVARDAKNLQVCYTGPPVAAAPPPPPPPSAIQLSDINFGANSARVNNCAKRVLGNELYPQLTGARYSDYDVVLVGHRDPAEREVTGKKPATSTIDRDRVLNAAAFLTARGATCKDLEMTRVKAVWAGTAQSNEYRSNFCDGSTVEQRRDVVNAADASVKNRRVEIWLVPKGTSLPNVSSVEASTDDITVLGCPK